MNKVLLIITGSIAAPKALELYDLLIKKYEVNVIASPASFKFVKFPKNLTVYHEFLEADFYDKNQLIKHTNLANKHDLIVVYPATMNFLSKAAIAIPDNLALATFLASSEQKIIFPAMNHNMYLNPGLQNNLKILSSDINNDIIDPNVGILACQVVGTGRLKEPEEAFEIINHKILQKKFNDKVVLINYGATRTYIDDIRYITNNSSGKMGLSLIKACLKAGAQVIAVEGDISVSDIINHKNLKVIKAVNNYDVLQIMEQYYSQADIVFNCAALNDYQVINKFSNKISKIDNEELTIKLEKNIDILQKLGQIKTHQLLIGFSAEDGIGNKWKQKMKTKNCDGMVVNDYRVMNQNDSEVNFHFNNKKYVFSGSKQLISEKIVKVLIDFYQNKE